MTQEGKQLLLKDLCARLPYYVKCHVPTKNKVMTLTGKRLNYFCFHDDLDGLDFSNEYECVLDPLNDFKNDYIVKPYLRPMSSMPEEESTELSNIIREWFDKELFDLTEEPFFECALSRINYSISPLLFEWLNEHHFDYRGLIKKGLALEAKEGMYK